MTGKFMAYVLSMIAFFYIILISISFFIYITTEERINDICFDAAETVSTRGELSQEVFAYMKSNISCYGNYEIILTLEHLNEEGQVYYFLGEDQIINKSLSKGDRVIISATGESTTLFEKITGSERGISVVKTAIIN